MTKVAVIEDNPDNRLLVQAILEDRYDVTEYETGVDAELKFQDDMPDVVLLDISLPDIDGTQVLRNIRAAGFTDLPVIALTAHAMSGDREKYLSEGFDDYITKPIIDEEDLIGAIERQLNR